MRSEDTDKKVLAEKILRYSRRYITQQAPLLLAPIYALREEISPVPGPMATDGVRLWYDPEQVIQDFRKERTEPARQILHITLHCLLGHLTIRPSHPQLFDLAADWKTAQLSYAMVSGLVKTRGVMDYGHLSLYRLMEQLQGDKRQMKSFAKRAIQVHADDHDRWSLSPQASRKSGTRRGAESGGAGPDADGAIQTEQAANSKPNSTGQTTGLPGTEDAPDWQELAQQLCRQAAGWGAAAGLLAAELMPAEENGISYERFLRRFAAPRERLLLDPDSFDPRWYYLGLEQYGDIPLLEPAEISEPPAPDDLVIALDTSGSCDGEICRRFLRETLSLLRDISAGAASFRILLLQCDAEIQNELLLEDSGQIDTFLEDFTPAGFGGTDFRPVFDHISRRRDDGTLPWVKGLLYLSDGYGSFPEEAPDYPVVFLLPQEDRMWFPDIPDWVTTLTIRTDDFTLKEASQ